MYTQHPFIMECKVCNIGLIFVIFYVISLFHVQITLQKRRIFNPRRFIQNPLSLTVGDRNLLEVCTFHGIGVCFEDASVKLLGSQI